MSTSYPSGLDSYTTKVDGVDDVMASHINNPQDAIVAIETELGTDPSCGNSSVAERLAVLGILAQFGTLPGLCGFWPMAGMAISSGNAADTSGNGKALAYHGNPRYVSNNLVNYIALDGVGDYLSRADEADLDITGTETLFTPAFRGLTMGGWIYHNNAVGSVEVIMSKYGAAGQRSYELRRAASGASTFVISDDGTTTFTATGDALTQNAWKCVIGRFDPSTSVDIWVNGVKASNTTSIPASIHAGTADFMIGNDTAGSGIATAYVALPFLTATCLTDAMIDDIFQNTRYLFGV
jgi:hypothetical protein